MRNFRLLLLLLILALGFSPSDAFQESAIDVNILAIDDGSYPDMWLYLSVINTLDATPITTLTPNDFLITTSENNERLLPVEVQMDTMEDRPVHLIVVLDLTSSISTLEFDNMRNAASLLMASLDVKDQVGVVTMDHEQVRVLQTLSPDHNAAINSLYTDGVAPVLNRDGNVVLDGIYRAVEVLLTPAPQVRPTVVVFTDASAGNVEGEHSVDDIYGLASQRGTTIHTVYFETEADGLPIRDELPIELEALAADTGGVIVQRGGESDGADYTDDVFLPEMAQQIANILEHEYRVRLMSLLPADDEIHQMSLVATSQGNVSPPVVAQFRARSGLITIEFIGVENGQQVEMPLDLEVQAVTSSGTIASLILYRIDNLTGGIVEIANLPPNLPKLSLTAENVPSGVLTLKAVGTDTTGNSAEQFLTLIVPGVSEGLAIETVPNIAASQTIPTGESDEDEGSGFRLFHIGLMMVLTGLLGSTFAMVVLTTVRRRRSEKHLTGALVDETSEQAMAPHRFAIYEDSPPPLPLWRDPMEEETLIDVETDAGLVVRALLMGPNGEEYPLYEGENTIGRHGTNTVQIMDITTSRYHAVIEIYGDKFEFLDWQPTHPSQVNGESLVNGNRHALKDGDQIKMGKTELKFIAKN